jgi:integrase
VALIKLKYVNSFANRDRKSARVRHYFRRQGEKAIPLPGLPGSEEFMAAYAMALAAIPDQTEIGANRTLPGSINALVVDYCRSAEWEGLAEQTRRVRRGIIERFRVEHGNKRVALMRPEYIEKMLAKIIKQSAKRDWLKAIRALLRFAVPTMLKADPTTGLKVKLPKSKGHHSWTDEEIAQYRAYWPLGTQQRLVMEFALETASRRGEVIRLGPQHVKNGRIRIERTHGSEDVDIPMSPELQAACEAMPITHLTYIVTAYGKPRSKHGLGNDFADEIITAEVRPKLADEARRIWGVENNIYQFGHRGYVAVKGGAQDCPYIYMRDLVAGQYRLPWEDDVEVTDGSSCGFAIPNRAYAG